MIDVGQLVGADRFLQARVARTHTHFLAPSPLVAATSTPPPRWRTPSFWHGKLVSRGWTSDVVSRLRQSLHVLEGLLGTVEWRPVHRRLRGEG
jgi:hypothetical protein